MNRYDEFGTEADDLFSRGRRLTRSAAIFGRGRMLSFLVMAALGLMSFVSKHTSWRPLQDVGRNINIGRGDAYLPSPNRLANVANAVGSIATNPLGQSQGYANQPMNRPMNRSNSQLTGQPANYASAVQPNSQLAWQPAAYVPQARQLTGQQVVNQHGGTVEDARTIQVRTIGNRLVGAVQNIQPGSMRFYLLQDSVNPQAYTIADGSILMTSALYGQLRSEGDLAAILSQRITEYIYRGYDVTNNAQVAQFRAQMLTAAGFDSRVITNYEASRSASQIASGGITRR